MRNLILAALFGSMMCSTAMAQFGRRGGGERVAVGNRSVNWNRGGGNFNNNRNVNINANVNYRGGGYGGGCFNCYYNNNGWSWGSFAAGAAVGAVTTAVAAAAAPQPVVMMSPPIGTIVPTLPGGCGTFTAPYGMIYGCNNVYYRPYYQGPSLVYQVVTYP